MGHQFLAVLLQQVASANLATDNPIVKALLGGDGTPGLVRIAHTVFLGAVMLRAMEQGYCWIIKGDAAYLRSCIMTAAAGVALDHAPIVFGVITGVYIPTLF